jgi:hypothetical protein
MLVTFIVRPGSLATGLANMCCETGDGRERLGTRLVAILTIEMRLILNIEMTHVLSRDSRTNLARGDGETGIKPCR